MIYPNLVRVEREFHNAVNVGWVAIVDIDENTRRRVPLAGAGETRTHARGKAEHWQSMGLFGPYSST